MRQGRFSAFVTGLLLSPSSMNNFARVYRFVLSIQTDTKATAACHAADLGYTDSQIRALGRWKSDGFKLYIRNETLAAN